jgi:polysaccharide transporter, PST family
MNDSINNNNKIALNLCVVLVERILQLSLSIVCLGLIARSISVDANGQFAYAFGLATVFLTLSFYAGSELIVPNLSKYKYLQKNILRTGFYLRIIYGFICFVVSSIFAILYLDDMHIRTAFFIFLCGPLVCESLYIYACWFSATGRNIWFSMARNTGLVIRFSSIYYLYKQSLLRHIEFEYFAYAYLFEAFAIAAVILYAYFTNYASPRGGRFKTKLAKMMLRDGVWIGIGLTINYFYIRLDRIILERLVDFNQLGIYAGAAQLNDAWVNTGIIFITVVAPYYIFNCKDCKLAKKRLYILMLVFSSFAAIGSIIINMLSSTVIIAVLGDKYINSIPVLNAICWISILIFVNQLFYAWWLREKAYKLQIIVFLSGSLAVWLFANYLVPLYGLFGMIYALAIAQALMFIGQYVYLMFMRKL